MEPWGPCAACVAPREGDKALGKVGTETGETHWVKAGPETPVWGQPSLQLSSWARHWHSVTWQGWGARRQGPAELWRRDCHSP